MVSLAQTPGTVVFLGTILSAKSLAQWLSKNPNRSPAPLQCGPRTHGLDLSRVVCLPAVARWRAGRARRAQAPCANDAGDRDFLTSDLNLAPTFWLLVHHLAAVDLYEDSVAIAGPLPPPS